MICLLLCLAIGSGCALPPVLQSPAQQPEGEDRRQVLAHGEAPGVRLPAQEAARSCIQ